VDERNRRWCSDGFEIGCDNGERVRVAFALDCCDREAMSFLATTGGIAGEDVRDLMRLPSSTGSARSIACPSRSNGFLITAVATSPATPAASPATSGSTTYDDRLNPHSPDNALSFGVTCAIQI